MKADQTLDCMGIYCPTPIIKTTTKMKDLKTGEILEVVSDDKRIRLDMPDWCRTTGHEFLGIEEQGGEIKVYVKKSHN
ncbi:MAG: sulfurtransferase TusA family protein [Dehalococcoidales bacterium]|jgi:TusA-related sulfurtransferase|nr:sulfurtransferase TusA family protein [Dehalococcoidales bacterium]MDP6738082.1 sulfurtransferase TusA family protein [Dehalococcoidales bacterium]|tara:strand:+ start:79 stop:312 length:234 start_codon:yes stop_codon:yes gene_type:complete